MIPHYYNSKLYITIFTYPKWFSFTGCKNWRDNFVFSKISKTIKCYFEGTLYRGSSNKAEVFEKKNDTVKVKIKNLFYSHNSINGILK